MRIDRPELPEGYGVEDAGPYISWDDVVGRLAAARNYWLSTTWPDGRPHVVPRWGAWLDNAFWYDGSPETRHMRNLTVNSACALHLESGDEVTIVDGTSIASEPVTGDLGERLSEEFGLKYAPAYAPGPDSWSDGIAGGLRILTPKKVIAWSDYPKGLTRFRF
ncbi:MAG: pyridoxamine 5'-phosphate oxidase family protein [Actinomycetota bacterium]|nr:pyridoxamine 5'-phosphate oxidase family protein [Actinomycetota bacterium]